MNTTLMISPEKLNAAVRAYPSRVTGPYSGCRHVADVLEYAIHEGGAVARLAVNYVTTKHGACWNALCGVLPADGWLIYYSGRG